MGLNSGIDIKGYDNTPEVGVLSEVSDVTPENTEKALHTLKTEVQDQKEQSLQGENQYIYGLINGTPFGDIMNNKLEGSGITLQERSESIEENFGKFVFTILPEDLQKLVYGNSAIKETIQGGISLYFMQWLKDMQNNPDQLSLMVNNIDSQSTMKSALGIFNLFRGFKSFHGQLASVNTVVDMMTIHTDQLTSPGKNHITTLPAFANPASFAALLKKHTPLAGQSPVSAHDISFEQAFDMKQVAPIDAATLIAGLDGEVYTDTAHKLMEQVHKYGPQILEKREKTSDAIGELYDHLSPIMSLFGENSLSEMVEGTWIGSIANFVCKLFGKSSLKEYEKTRLSKDLNKTIPSQHREAIAQTLGYISTNSTDARYERYNELEKLISVSAEDKGNLMPLLPNQALMIESVKESMKQDQPLFIDPGVLQAAGINPQEYYIQDKDKKPIINPEKLSEYKKIVSKKVEKICTLQRKKLLNPSILKALLESGKTKEDLTIYLMTGLSYPAQAQQAAQYSLIRPIDMVSPPTVDITPILVEDEGIDHTNRKYILKTKNEIDNLSIEQKAKETYRYLHHKGYKDIQVQAIVANIQVESQFNTGAIGDQNLTDKAYGLCQWRMDRYKNLQKFARQNNKQWDDFYLQLDFMMQESGGRTEGFEQQFLQANSVAEATRLFDTGYERSNGKSIDQRIAIAQQHKNTFSAIA